MYFLQDMCCLCLTASNLTNFKTGKNKLTNFDKIITSLTSIANVLETNFDYKICKKCSETIDMIYNFNENCLKNIKTLSSYNAILKENKEKKRCQVRIAIKKLESTENNESAELISVKTEIQVEPIREAEHRIEDNPGNFIAVKVKEEVEDPPIFDEDFNSVQINEIELKAEIEDRNLKTEYFYEIHEDNIGPENRNLQPGVGSNVHPSTSKLDTPSSSINKTEEIEDNERKYFLQFAAEKVQKSIINSENQLVSNEPVQNNTKCICNVHSRTFENQCELNSHLQITNSRVSPFNCDICKKSFSLKSYLRRHMLIHTSENPYVCEVCSKVFSRKSHLNTHKLIHSETKPFACSECDKTFTQKSHLVVHQRIHTGDKPYACDVCDKAYTQKQHLNDHKRIHTGDRPYVCDVCDKAFTQKSYLTEHRRIHTGEKPYVCDVCTRSFAVRSTLKKHKKIHEAY